MSRGIHIGQDPIGYPSIDIGDEPKDYQTISYSMDQIKEAAKLVADQVKSVHGSIGGVEITATWEQVDDAVAGRLARELGAEHGIRLSWYMD